MYIYLYSLILQNKEHPRPRGLVGEGHSVPLKNTCLLNTNAPSLEGHQQDCHPSCPTRQQILEEARGGSSARKGTWGRMDEIWPSGTGWQLLLQTAP